MLTEKLKILTKTLIECETTDDVVNSLKDLFGRMVRIFIFDPDINTLRSFSKHWKLSENMDIDFDKIFNGEISIKNNTLYFPIMKKSRFIGLIAVEKYTNEIKNLLEIAIYSISLKVENIILSTKMQKDVEFHDSMKNIAKIIETQYELNYIVPIIGEILDTFISNHLIYIFLKENGKFKLEWPAACLDNKIMQTLKALKADSTPVISEDQKTGYFPLVNENSLIGCIVTKRMDSPLIPREIEYLQQLTTQASTTIHRANVYAEILKHATLDALTGFYNRRQMEERIKQEVASAKRKHTSLCAIMIDIDYFKKVNDTYGHATGDFILKTVSKIMRSQLREYDIAARYGGEEFAILLPFTEEDEAVMVGERLRKSVESRVIDIEKVNSKNNTKAINITISLGIYKFKNTDKISDLLINADKALYNAKETGRNKVIVYKE